MNRLTARLLLTIMLVGVLAPLTLAIATPPPHACCMRKMMHARGSSGAELSNPPACCNHDCCHALTVSNCPYLPPVAAARTAVVSVRLAVEGTAVTHNFITQTSHSGRAPPHHSSIA